MSYTGSPKPMMKPDPNPLFTMEEGEYVVKALTPIERQRQADGTLHSMHRPSAVEPNVVAPDDKFYIASDKVEKAVSTSVDLNPDEVVKAFMEEGEYDV